MNDRIVIITGANSGMGLATTVELAKQGATVVMACRSEERGRQALQEAQAASGSDRLELMLCDLGSLSSIRSFAAEFHAKYKRLDVLINNAGVFAVKRVLTKDGFESMIGVNHLGHFLLTLLLLPLLLNAPQGRVVNVSSGASKAGRINLDDPHMSRSYGFWKGYAQSKLANVLFTRELARRLSGTRVTVNCLHPGAVATNIGVDRGTGFGRNLIKMVKPFFLTAEQGADTIVYLASSDEVAQASGEYYYKRRIASNTELSRDEELARRFWAWSEEQVGQTYEWEPVHSGIDDGNGSGSAKL
ncbi:SDR family oxidoreductase [Paenibacillus filicis]|uniref:SDR family oxidoreductase n=1 Tax=Paenibacillus filicis TaxID=669464 RepID=A0ABU9DMM1_9BACL